ncbi:uncharacterized protein [Macrobrachium rosenbergii]|uniref:uncharacterized protein n=1 Tax=Macrobrachium rosenbergii TaxID=79674 RepID=UPI0034D70A9B
MRALQLALRRSWDFDDDSVLIPWDSACHDDLLWWIEEDRLASGISLVTSPPELLFWSDASDVGWGANLTNQFASGIWSSEESVLSINARELIAVERGLHFFQDLLKSRTVAVFSDNTTAISYLRRGGGVRSVVLNDIAQRILRWTETLQISLRPQFVMGRCNVIADALSRPNQIIGSEWTLDMEVFNKLRRRWPVNIDLFATSLNHRCDAYIAPTSDPMAVGVDAMLYPWDNLQAYAFPPFAMIRQVINKLKSSTNCQLTLIVPLWLQREWFPDLMEHLLEPPVPLPPRRNHLRQPHVRRFHRNPRMLRLHACRLFSDSREPQGSLLEWLRSLATAEENLL